MKPLVGCLLASIVILGVSKNAYSQAGPEPGQVFPALALSGTYVRSPDGHPNILVTRTTALAFLTAAQTNTAKNIQLIRLDAYAKQVVANSVAVTTYETPVTGSELLPYLNNFSVFPTGAAQVAVRLAYYVYLQGLGQGYGDAVIAAEAKTVANTILRNWATSGFRINGAAITSYDQFHEATTVPPTADADVWSSVGLQIGRGILAYTIAADLLNDATKSQADDTVINSFITTMRSLLIGAANDHYDYNYHYGCHRYDNQAEMVMAALAATGRYTNNAALVQTLAGTSTAAGLEWSWPQQMQGTIYGNGDTVRTCQDPADAGDTYNPVVSPGEITDRERVGDYKPFGYTGGNMLSMIEVAAILQNAGYQSYQFVGSKGQSLKLALDYYSWYVTTFLADQVVYLPASANYPDFTQYAGAIYTMANGASIMGADSLLAPYIIGNQVYPNDPKIVASLNKASSLGTTAYVPGSELDILIMMIDQ